jgi:hypothetical protein
MEPDMASPEKIVSDLILSTPVGERTDALVGLITSASFGISIFDAARAADELEAVIARLRAKAVARGEAA